MFSSIGKRRLWYITRKEARNQNKTETRNKKKKEKYRELFKREKIKKFVIKINKNRRMGVWDDDRKMTDDSQAKAKKGCGIYIHTKCRSRPSTSRRGGIIQKNKIK